MQAGVAVTLIRLSMWITGIVLGVAIWVATHNEGEAKVISANVPALAGASR